MSANDPICAAIVGLGRWGQNLMAAATNAPDHPLRFVQGVTRTQSKAAQFTKHHGIPVSDDYDAMLESGERSISSPALINQWLAGVNARYAPVLTAYNLSFDLGKCRNTRINLGIFSERFCLMKAAKKSIGVLADYQDFCYDNDLLTKKLRKPQMTADAMAKYIVGEGLADEPHTALEDARDYEAVILNYILRNVTRKQLLELGQ